MSVAKRWGRRERLKHIKADEARERVEGESCRDLPRRGDEHGWPLGSEGTKAERLKSGRAGGLISQGGTGSRFCWLTTYALGARLFFYRREQR